MRDKIYVALVHSPVYNKNRETVCTSVTNFDIHDISRTCRTYDINEYHIIIPAEAQKLLTKRIIGYWQDGVGGAFNKDREEAFERTFTLDSIEEAIKRIEEETGSIPNIITTSARIFKNSVSFEELSKKIFTDEKPYLILFGTGWGLTDEIMNMSTYVLEPIRGQTKYNHLSVRAAVSIILDRLLGEN
ncbi:RNA methyltransferase [Fusobacterium sp. PH5-44]|uniref:RNA methyltransferase n=1 Tax=unclassified Fusobacterium TaxID=2648384 RepID=UPI003D25CCB4